MPAQMMLLSSAKLGGNHPSGQLLGQDLTHNSEDYCKLGGLQRKLLAFQMKIISG
jgi:hypothetical protein